MSCQQNQSTYESSRSSGSSFLIIIVLYILIAIILGSWNSCGSY